MSRKPKLTMWIAVAALVAANAVLAQEAIPTAANAPDGGAPMPTATGPLRLPDRRADNGDDIVRSGNSCGAPPKANGAPDRSPHGEVFAGVGTHGYREGGGVVCVPLSDAVSATVAIDAGRYGDRGRH